MESSNAIIEIEDLNLADAIMENNLKDGFIEIYLPWISAGGILLNITVFVFCVLKFSTRRNGKFKLFTNVSETWQGVIVFKKI